MKKAQDLNICFDEQSFLARVLKPLHIEAWKKDVDTLLRPPNADDTYKEAFGRFLTCPFVLAHIRKGHVQQSERHRILICVLINIYLWQRY